MPTWRTTRAAVNASTGATRQGRPVTNTVKIQNTASAASNLASAINTSRKLRERGFKQPCLHRLTRRRLGGN